MMNTHVDDDNNGWKLCFVNTLKFDANVLAVVGGGVVVPMMLMVDQVMDGIHV